MKLNKLFNNKTAAALLALAATAGMSSCSDMLDTKPQGTFSEEQIGADNYTELLTSAYATLMNHFIGNNEAFAGPINNWVMDVRTDDAYKGGGAMNYEEYMHQLEVGNVRSDMQTVNFKWKNCYYAIARCNVALKAIRENDNIPNRESVVAEMKTLRAYYWFELYRVYKDFPFYTEDENPSEVSIRDHSREQIMAAIKEDLKESYNLLPASQPVVGRFNKYVAAAIMAKVCLWDHDYSQAEYYANEVMASGKYSLYPNFLDMSNPAFNNQYEAVLAVQFSSASQPDQFNFNNCLNCPKTPGDLYGPGDGFYRPSQNLVNAFRTDENGLPYFDTFNDIEVNENYNGNVDPRLDFTIGRIGMPWRAPDLTYSIEWCFAPDIYGTYSNKKPYTDPRSEYCTTNIVPWGANTLNMLLIRYADVMLMKAEALVEQNKNLNEARDIVNQIRRRAKNSLLDVNKAMNDCNPMLADYSVEEYTNSWNQDFARKAVRMERRIELAMEGHRWFDLVRWGEAVNVINAYYSTEVRLRPYLAGAHLTSANLYFPVPQEQLDNAGNLYK